MSAAPRHLDALTGIRGIAAWAVVLYHIRLSLAGLLPAPVIDWLARGYLAVDLFFILSGFVIWYNYAPRLRQGGAAETRLFLWRRFARVWPLHAFILTGFCAFAALLLVTGRDAGGYPLAELPLHFALAQNWGLTGELTWNHPAWSISTELAAYLLFPAVVALTRWEDWPDWALVLLALALAGTIHLIFAASGHTALGEDIARLGLWRCLPEFGMGMILCILWQRWQSVGRAAPLALLAGLAWGAGGIALGLPETALVPLLFFALLLALALDRSVIARVLGGRGLTYLGEISYSTYLAHFFLFILFKLAFVDDSLQLDAGQLAGFIALVAGASVALYHGVEKPAQRWLNRRPPRWASPAIAIPAE
ncbi:acyltransferase [Novosphingobium sp.]|uniref:acyltransferase family protein n=1 Tax=Novosphingobium sp. TaxID=1874826 RepID=UPI0027335955|nr:acyltransferase [Novosphingobium sp.]MDP3907831.1 acyltransferase [Novosphingobium sp.]